jgi:hypothetical protein
MLPPDVIAAAPGAPTVTVSEWDAALAMRDDAMNRYPYSRMVVGWCAHYATSTIATRCAALTSGSTEPACPCFPSPTPPFLWYPS